MNILAIDPATQCGWAHSCGPCGTWDLSVRSDESSGMKLLRLQGKVAEIYSSVGIDIVYFEAARFAMPDRQHAVMSQNQFIGALVVWCEQNKIQYRGVAPTEVKKFATGKGNANKEQMIAAAKKKWPGAEIQDDNTADALWILEFAMNELKSAVAIPKQSELKV